MSTVYKYNIEIVSDFCAYPEKEIEEKLKRQLTKTEFTNDPKNWLHLSLFLQEEENSTNGAPYHNNTYNYYHQR